MGRTKPIVLQVTHKSARSGSKKSLGVIAFRPRKLARVDLTLTEHGKLTASLEEPNRLSHSTGGLLQTPKVFETNVSDLPRAGQNASCATPERLANNDGGSGSERKVMESEEERDTAELFIDETGVLDPRKADPHMFGASDRGETKTRRSAAKQSVDGDNTNITDMPNAPTYTAVAFMEDKGQARTHDASGASQTSLIDVNMELVSGIQSELSRVPSNISAPITSAAPSTGANINSQVITHDGELTHGTPPANGGSKSSSNCMAAPAKASRKRSRIEAELETIGTPLIQESITGLGTSLTKEYSVDGKKWFIQPGSSVKPDWAVYERDIDIRRDE